MKLTREILWNEKFINKFTNLRTSFLIFLTKILIDASKKEQYLFDDSWLYTVIRSDCYELFKKTNTFISLDSTKTSNYYPHIVNKTKFGKPILNCKASEEKRINYAGENIKFEDGVKYILNKLFEDIKHDSQIELFRIEISNFITKENENNKNELIEEMFKYLSEKFAFPSSIEYRSDYDLYYIESVYKIYTAKNDLTSNLDLYFTISFKLCSGNTDTPISFKIDSLKDFDLFYKELKDNAKKFIHKQKIASRIEREMNKYL